jgi:hypothetical protein
MEVHTKDSSQVSRMLDVCQDLKVRPPLVPCVAAFEVFYLLEVARYCHHRGMVVLSLIRP